MRGKAQKKIYKFFSAVILFGVFGSESGALEFFFLFVWMEFDRPPDKRLLAKNCLLCDLRHSHATFKVSMKNFQSVNPTARSDLSRENSIYLFKRIHELFN